MLNRHTTLQLAGLAVVAALPAILGCGSDSATATTAPASAVSPPALEAAPAAITAAVPATPPERPTLRPGAKTRVLAAAGDKPYDKTFDDLRFDMTLEDRFHRDMLSDSIEAMFGQRIRIRGFMLPTAQKNGIKEFVLVRDNQECCFGPGAALYDCIYVQMKVDQTTEFSIRPVAVEGTFDFREIVVDGRHWAIYHLDGESVR
jgi:hypothetical protein